DLRKKPDLFGRPLKTSELGLADELASAASLIMGQSSEGRPVVLAGGGPYARREGEDKESADVPERLWLIAADSGESFPLYKEKLEVHAFAWSADGAKILLS